MSRSGAYVTPFSETAFLQSLADITDEAKLTARAKIGQTFVQLASQFKSTSLRGKDSIAIIE